MNIETNKKHENKSLGCRLSYAAFASILVIAVLAGCSKRYHNLPAFWAIPVGDAENHSVGRFKTTYLADQIHAYFRGNTRAPVAVSTFVNIDDLYASSTFGRILTEQLMSELAMRGYNVIEVRQSEALQISFGEGEFGLSRETAALRNGQEISGLIVGTYAVSPVRVYLNARLIDPLSSLIISVGTVELSKTHEIDRLLRTNMLPSTLERIPVRHLGYASHPAPYYFPQNYWPSFAPPGTAPFGEPEEEDEEFILKYDEGESEKSADKQETPPVPTLEPTT